METIIKKSIENLKKSNELIKVQFDVTDQDLLIIPEFITNPPKGFTPYPSSVLFNGYSYLESVTDLAMDPITIFSFTIDPNQDAQTQVKAFRNWLRDIYGEAWPTLQTIKPQTTNPNTYLIIASQYM